MPYGNFLLLLGVVAEFVEEIKHSKGESDCPSVFTGALCCSALEGVEHRKIKPTVEGDVAWKDVKLKHSKMSDTAETSPPEGDQVLQPAPIQAGDGTTGPSSAPSASEEVVDQPSPMPASSFTISRDHHSASPFQSPSKGNSDTRNGSLWTSPHVSPVPVSTTVMGTPNSPGPSPDRASLSGTMRMSRRDSASSIGSDRSLSRERARTLKISSNGKRVEIRLPSREKNNLPALLGFEVSTFGPGLMLWHHLYPLNPTLTCLPSWQLFRGFTRFAPGLWSGIALDAPSKLNWFNFLRSFLV